MRISPIELRSPELGLAGLTPGSFRGTAVIDSVGAFSYVPAMTSVRRFLDATAVVAAVLVITVFVAEPDLLWALCHEIAAAIWHVSYDLIARPIGDAISRSVTG